MLGLTRVSKAHCESGGAPSANLEVDFYNQKCSVKSTKSRLFIILSGEHLAVLGFAVREPIISITQFFFCFSRKKRR